MQSDFLTVVEKVLCVAEHEPLIQCLNQAPYGLTRPLAH